MMVSFSDMRSWWRRQPVWPGR